MIIKDEETIEEALQMLAVSPQGVRYSDRYAYIIVTVPETLELLCRRALAHGDIAVAVPLGHESGMENYTASLRNVRVARAREEKKKIKEWVREHPEVVEKIEKKLK